MRPPILDPIFAPTATLNGIGPKLTKLLDKLLDRSDRNIPARVIDLILHLPTSVIDRSYMPGIANAPDGAIVTVHVVVDRHIDPPPGNLRVPYVVDAHDGTGDIRFVFFRAHRQSILNRLPTGDQRFVSGRIERFQDRAQMVHPDYITPPNRLDDLPKIEPIYPSTAGLTRKVLRKAVTAACQTLPAFTEWIDPSVLAKHAWPGFTDALRRIHEPNTTDFEQAPERRRLSYDELFASQLALQLVRANLNRQPGVAHRFDDRRARMVLNALPFELTDGQRAAIEQIKTDLAAPARMLRMLQGDVGSGKTIVALLACCAVVEAGAQASIMAPTEVLARQHAASMQHLCEAAGLRIEVLTGREKGKVRQAILDDVRDGAIDILVGTHALFQSGVVFHKLGLAVVDEQHRFGVQQRLALAGKGARTDILVMTATPIPRTLVMTYFGDMDVSVLPDKPAGRRAIQTSVLSADKTPALLKRVRTALADGAKLYWICPLVEPNEELDLVSAEERHADLKRQFGDAVGLVHGRMTGAQKDAAMAAFKTGETRLLVATTVVEVGVDVPDATIIVIEHAERFGLSQLHQLRGRVGRSDLKSTCILLYKGKLGKVAGARLDVMRQTEDGFRIAEEDLRLRGEGEILGTRQSGTPGFKVADPARDADLLATARDDARLLCVSDPNLVSARGQAARNCLYLFDQDEAVRMIGAG